MAHLAEPNPTGSTEWFMDLPRLFFEKMNHLRDLAAQPTEYRLLQAAAIVRHLLLDSSPLVDSISAITRLRPYYAVGCMGMVEHFGSIVPQKPLVFTVAHSVDPMRPQRPIVYLKRDEFLALKVAILSRQEFTVRDVVSYCANAAGGVHHNAKEDRLKIMKGGAKVSILGIPQFEQLMDGISHAVIFGLRGTEAKLHNLLGLEALSAGFHKSAEQHFRRSMELLEAHRDEIPEIWDTLEKNLARCEK